MVSQTPIESNLFIEYAVKKFLGSRAPSRIEILRENGKPFIKNNLVFVSLSHSHGVTAVAVARTAVGIDIERVREMDCGAIEKRFFGTAHSAQRTAHNGGKGLETRDERRETREGNIVNNSTPMPYALCPMPSPMPVAQIPMPSKKPCFFESWTAKEAISKARGIPLIEALRISDLSGVRHFDLIDGYKIAVCV